MTGLRGVSLAGSRCTTAWRGGGMLLAAVLLAGCAGPAPVAPVGRAPARDAPAPPARDVRATAPVARGLHTVRRGDTLYSIAWRYGLDYRDVARWNAIPEPFTIRPGQRLRVTRPARLPPMPAPARTTREAPPASRSTASRATPAPSPAMRTPSAARRSPAKPGRTQRPATSPVREWSWPVRGKVVGRFGKKGGKGIDIAGKRGAPVRAAAPGFVVYSGSGLRGYGRLIIVKHDKRYLSAYAHNDRLHVKEGDTVVRGQRIADMGSTGAKSVKLHFEIRRDGKPVDPIRFLPR